jgi:hypothetical protein
VVPKSLCDELGFASGMELEVDAVDGRLEVTVPSRVRAEEGPHGVRLTVGQARSLSTEQVRELMERGRR